MKAGPDRIAVHFDGEGAGVGELAWGQQEAWMSIRRLGSWMPLGGVKPLAPGTTVEDVAAELRYLMSRFQVLRSQVRLSAGQRPAQEVFAHGEIDLDLVDADGEDPAEAAARVRRRYAETALDLEAEWPIRMAVVLDRGRPTHMIALISHFAVDAHGAQVMLDDVAARTTTPVTGTSPLEQAAWQQSGAGQRQNESALRYYESVLRSIGPSRFPAQPAQTEPKIWNGEFTSRALPKAVARITAGTGFDAATSLLALFAVAQARVTRVNPVVLRPMVGNRFRRGLADVVCSLTQAGLCVLDVADAPFEDVLARVKRTTMTAYKHAYHNPFDLEELLTRVSRERGVDINIACFYNNRRGESPTASAAAAPAATTATTEAAPTVEQMRKVLPDSVFRGAVTGQKPMRRTFARVEPDVADAMRLSILLDTGLLSPADGQAWLQEIEAVAVQAAGRV
ncbi:hypothetical protein ABH920_003734 [Catenulispora sp. EB89]|uniref:condensation domain-containing protein n=1 Tax=Catenulispora sp. EB89 TaxID=3156257 RepID=UPI0035122689